MFFKSIKYLNTNNSNSVLFIVTNWALFHHLSDTSRRSVNRSRRNGFLQWTCRFSSRHHVHCYSAFVQRHLTLHCCRKPSGLLYREILCFGVGRWSQGEENHSLWPEQRARDSNNTAVWRDSWLWQTQEKYFWTYCTINVLVDAIEYALLVKPKAQIYASVVDLWIISHHKTATISYGE